MSLFYEDEDACSASGVAIGVTFRTGSPSSSGTLTPSATVLMEKMI